jgi:hypothetical protein
VHDLVRVRCRQGGRWPPRSSEWTRTGTVSSTSAHPACGLRRIDELTGRDAFTALDQRIADPLRDRRPASLRTDARRTSPASPSSLASCSTKVIRLALC